VDYSFLYSDDYLFTRVVFQKSLAFVYFIGFLIAANQSPGLIGERGILPAKLFMKQIRFRDYPSLFHFKFSNQLLKTAAWIGVALALFAFSGTSEQHGYVLSFATWFFMWILYMSFVNIGQEFYGFGWETLLLETGFLAMFLGPASSSVPVLIIYLYRWLAFRLMFGAGLIKIRGDECWRDFTCMFYHYESQPLPGPLSRAFHHAPRWLNKFSVLVNHIVELILPFLLFGPGYLRWIAGAGIILFQFTIFIGGNYSWLNVISMVTCIFCFDDDFFRLFAELPKPMAAVSLPHMIITSIVFIFIAALSYRPAKNLFSKRQAMNRSFDRLHLCNTYGAFGTVTRNRPEIIVEGTRDATITDSTLWVPYEFKGKPGDLNKRPRQVSPYHYKLDWQLWFAAMADYRYNTWTLSLVARLLQREPAVMSLIKRDPFQGDKPTFVRAELYIYNYTDKGEPGTWKRTRLGTFLPPLSLKDETFREYLESEGWL
jgi:Protein of unknown function (DUF1222).